FSKLFVYILGIFSFEFRYPSMVYFTCPGFVPFYREKWFPDLVLFNFPFLSCLSDPSQPRMGLDFGSGVSRGTIGFVVGLLSALHKHVLVFQNYKWVGGQ